MDIAQKNYWAGLLLKFEWKPTKSVIFLPIFDQFDCPTVSSWTKYLLCTQRKPFQIRVCLFGCWYIYITRGPVNFVDNLFLQCFDKKSDALVGRVDTFLILLTSCKKNLLFEILSFLFLTQNLRSNPWRWNLYGRYP